MKVVEGLYYSKDHEWLKVEDGRGVIGITDHAQEGLGDVVYVELPGVDDEFSAGDALGVVESVKAASDIYIPVSGKVLEVNEDLANSPEQINADPYGSWMIVVELTNLDELNDLMNAEEYQAYCKEEG